MSKKKSEGGPYVGDKLRITLTLECTMAASGVDGTMFMRLNECIADVSNVQDDGTKQKLGNIGGGIAGHLIVEVNTADKGSIILHCSARDQWLAVVNALKAQYGFEPNTNNEGGLK